MLQLKNKELDIANGKWEAFMDEQINFHVAMRDKSLSAIMDKVRDARTRLMVLETETNKKVAMEEDNFTRATHVLDEVIASRSALLPFWMTKQASPVIHSGLQLDSSSQEVASSAGIKQDSAYARQILASPVQQHASPPTAALRSPSFTHAGRSPTSTGIRSPCNRSPSFTRAGKSPASSGFGSPYTQSMRSPASAGAGSPLAQRMSPSTSVGSRSPIPIASSLPRTSPMPPSKTNAQQRLDHTLLSNYYASNLLDMADRGRSLPSSPKWW